MQKGLKIASGLALLLSAASTPVHAGGATDTFRIAQISAREMGFEVKVNGPINNPANCPFPNQLRINKTEENYSVIVSTLTTAFIAQKPVYLWTVGCHSDGRVNFIAVFVDN